MRANPARQDRELQDLYEGMREGLFRFAYLLVGTRADAEDLVQAAFASLAERWHEVSNPHSYLRAVVVNRAADLHRRAFRRAPARPHVVVAEPDVDEMWDAVQRLSATQRAVVVLRFYEDLSLAQIAGLLRRPTATVRSDLHRALKKLRKGLTDG